MNIIVDGQAITRLRKSRRAERFRAFRTAESLDAELEALCSYKLHVHRTARLDRSITFGKAILAAERKLNKASL